MNSETNVVEIDNWIIRQRLPIGNRPHKLLVMLHGWTGDENSMWIFANRIPENYKIISPRGPFQTPLGGYGWGDHIKNRWPTVDDFQPAIEGLITLLQSRELQVNQSKSFSLMGFSQGAALAYSLAFAYPGRIDKLAGLSGFFPEPTNGTSIAGSLDGKEIYVAHGLKDEMVPVEKGRRVVEALKRSGADVIYCEEDVGHKLSSGCFRGLGEYFDD